MLRRFTQFLMKPDEPVAGDPATPEVTPEPAAVTPPEPVPTPAAGDAPWSQDLVSLFPDEAVRGQVDQYLRTKVQPHTTKLEQQVAAAQNATALYTDLQADPVGTFTAIGEQLFEDEQVAALKAALGIEEPAAPITPAAAPITPAMDPRLEALLAREEERERQQHWDTETQRIGIPAEQHRLLAPFVVAAEGDFDAAKAAYDQYVADFTAAHGAPPAAEPPAPVAPGVLGTGDGGGGAPVPVEPKYDSLDAAFDATMDEIRAARSAPAVI